jgi:hypothetical protein
LNQNTYEESGKPYDTIRLKYLAPFLIKGGYDNNHSSL